MAEEERLGQEVPLRSYRDSENPVFSRKINVVVGVGFIRPEV